MESAVKQQKEEMQHMQKLTAAQTTMQQNLDEQMQQIAQSRSNKERSYAKCNSYYNSTNSGNHSNSHSNRCNSNSSSSHRCNSNIDTHLHARRILQVHLISAQHISHSVLCVCV